MQNLELIFESRDISLDVRRFRVEEGISELFRIRITAVTANVDLPLEAIVGKAVAFRLTSRLSEDVVPRLRVWTGMVHWMEQSRTEGSASGLSTYELTLVPILWRLTQRRNNRIFQHVTIPQIIDRLLDEWHIERTWRITREAYAPVELRTQWEESDFDFFCRLLEEAGISFFFQDDLEKGSILVLSEQPQKATESRSPLPFVDEAGQASAGRHEYVTHVRIGQEVTPSRFTYRDYDFRNPRFQLFGQTPPSDPRESGYEQYLYRPSAFNMELSGDRAAKIPLLEQTKVADDKGTARFQTDVGDALAQRSLDAARAPRRTVTFETNVVDPSAGTIVRFVNHPRSDIDAARLLVVSFSLEGTAVGDWTMKGKAVFAEAPFRPAMITPKPRIYGLQSAIVVGPPGEEIYTDEFGRVRVQFHWDREGRRNEDSSIWMRVSQGWAGSRYGMMMIPRVNHEVLVGFLDGDPDSPLIVGRVYNAVERVPYVLPENKTVSTWKSDSSPGSNGYNEIKFEDKKHLELVYLQAEKDMGRLIKNDEVSMVGRDRVNVVEHDEIVSVKNDRVKVVQHDESIAVGQDRSAQIRRDEAVAVGRDKTDFVLRDRTESTGSNHVESVGVSRRTRIGAKELLEVGERYLVRVVPGLGERMARGLGSALEVPALGRMLGAAIGWSDNALESGTLSGLMANLLQDSFGATPLPSFLRGPLDALSPVIPQKVQAVLSLARAPIDRADAATDVPGTPRSPTQIEMVNRRITFTTGEASITLDGPDVRIEARGSISVLANKQLKLESLGDDVKILGGPRILLNSSEVADSTFGEAESPDEIA